MSGFFLFFTPSLAQRDPLDAYLNPGGEYSKWVLRGIIVLFFTALGKQAQEMGEHKLFEEGRGGPLIGFLIGLAAAVITPTEYLVAILTLVVIVGFISILRAIWSIGSDKEAPKWAISLLVMMGGAALRAIGDTIASGIGVPTLSRAFGWFGTIAFLGGFFSFIFFLLKRIRGAEVAEGTSEAGGGGGEGGREEEEEEEKTDYEEWRKALKKLKKNMEYIRKEVEG